MSETKPSATSFPKHKINVLLLENIHESAHEMFAADGFQVERLTTALPKKFARQSRPQAERRMRFRWTSRRHARLRRW